MLGRAILTPTEQFGGPNSKVLREKIWDDNYPNGPLIDLLRFVSGRDLSRLDFNLNLGADAIEKPFVVNANLDISDVKPSVNALLLQLAQIPTLGAVAISGLVPEGAQIKVAARDEKAAPGDVKFEV